MGVLTTELYLHDFAAIGGYFPIIPVDVVAEDGPKFSTFHEDHAVCCIQPPLLNEFRDCGSDEDAARNSHIASPIVASYPRSHPARFYT